MLKRLKVSHKQKKQKIELTRCSQPCGLVLTRSETVKVRGRRYCSECGWPVVDVSRPSDVEGVFLHTHD